MKQFSKSYGIVRKQQSYEINSNNKINMISENKMKDLSVYLCVCVSAGDVYEK